MFKTPLVKANTNFKQALKHMFIKMQYHSRFRFPNATEIISNSANENCSQSSL